MPFCPSCGSHHSNWQQGGTGTDQGVVEPHAADGLNSRPATAGPVPDQKGMNGPRTAKMPAPLPKR